MGRKIEKALCKYNGQLYSYKELIELKEVENVQYKVIIENLYCPFCKEKATKLTFNYCENSKNSYLSTYKNDNHDINCIIEKDMYQENYFKKYIEKEANRNMILEKLNKIINPVGNKKKKEKRIQKNVIEHLEEPTEIKMSKVSMKYSFKTKKISKITNDFLEENLNSPIILHDYMYIRFDDKNSKNVFYKIYTHEGKKIRLKTTKKINEFIVHNDIFKKQNKKKNFAFFGIINKEKNTDEYTIFIFDSRFIISEI